MQSQPTDTEYAGFWLRAGAYVVDLAIVLVVSLLLSVVGHFAGGATLAIAGIAGFLFQVLYWPVLESSPRQATYGKRMMGLQVEHANGGRTTFLRALGRNLAKIISSIPLGLGYVMAAFTGRKQALHDMIASCVVIRTGPSHFVKALLASLLGVAVALGSATAFFYYVYGPALMKDIGIAQQDATKSGPAVAPRPPPQPAAKAPPPPLPVETASAPEKAPASNAPAALPTPPAAPAASVQTIPPPPIMAPPPAAPPAPRQTAPTPATKRPPQASPRPEPAPCVIKPVMTDAEIDNCRRSQ